MESEGLLPHLQEPSIHNLRCDMPWWPEPTRFNIQKFYILLTECFYVSYDTCNKQSLYPQTALTNWVL